MQSLIKDLEIQIEALEKVQKEINYINIPLIPYPYEKQLENIKKLWIGNNFPVILLI